MNGRFQRTQTLNTSYGIYFKNCRDLSQFSYVARQFDPVNPKRVIEAFRDSTSEKYGYLFIDFSEGVPDDYRLKTCILPPEKCYVYVPKKT